eukprot:1673489-Amphidinium_carterae.1
MIASQSLTKNTDDYSPNIHDYITVLKCRSDPSCSSTTDAVNQLQATPLMLLRVHASFDASLIRFSRDQPENDVQGGAAITSSGFFSLIS